jgi:hypothetical protein
MCSTGPGRKVDYIRANEVSRFLLALEHPWEGFFEVALHCGMTPQELFRLRKEDVDLEARQIRIARPAGRGTTKAPHVIPFSNLLAMTLRIASGSRASSLVFPTVDDSRRPSGVEAALRHGLLGADLVLGYEHRCRVPGCGYRERVAGAGQRTCPRHGVMLWPTPVARPIGVRHLRYTTQSLLTDARADAATVRAVLRGGQPRTQIETYRHRDSTEWPEAHARKSRAATVVEPRDTSLAAWAGGVREVYTVPQAARALGVSTSTVRARIACGDLWASRSALRRAHLITPGDLAYFLSEHSVDLVRRPRRRRRPVR